MHSPDARRDFISVEWVAKAVMKSVDELMGPRKDMSNQHITYDVGTGCSMSFKELDAALRHIFCADSIVKWGSLPAQLIGRYQDHTKAGTGAKLICTFETGPTAVEQMRYTYGVSDV
jgi:hypothetical protein